MTQTKQIADMVNAAFRTVDKAKRKGQADLKILGGTFSPEQLKDWLNAWIRRPSDDFRWRIYEYPYRFDALDSIITPNGLPQSYAYLERARLFDEKGDLDIRRDGDTMHWRFIGDKNFSVPSLSVAAIDFWNELNEQATFLEIEEKYYQWRETDERVNSEWLGTLGLHGENVYLKQLQYWREGRVEFVRCVGFEQAEAKNGKR